MLLTAEPALHPRSDSLECAEYVSGTVKATTLLWRHLSRSFKFLRQGQCVAQAGSELTILLPFLKSATCPASFFYFEIIFVIVVSADKISRVKQNDR